MDREGAGEGKAGSANREERGDLPGRSVLRAATRINLSPISRLKCRNQIVTESERERTPAFSIDRPTDCDLPGQKGDPPPRSQTTRKISDKQSSCPEISFTRFTRWFCRLTRTNFVQTCGVGGCKRIPDPKMGGTLCLELDIVVPTETCRLHRIDQRLRLRMITIVSFIHERWPGRPGGRGRTSERWWRCSV